MNAVYLMFDAGYHSSVAPEVVRSDVASEAIRLATLLAESRATTGPAVHALAALTCLHGARLPGRLVALWAALGDLAMRAGDLPAARTWLARGLTTARTEGERDMFLRRLGDCGDALS